MGKRRPRSKCAREIRRQKRRQHSVSEKRGRLLCGFGGIIRVSNGEAISLTPLSAVLDGELSLPLRGRGGRVTTGLNLYPISEDLLLTEEDLSDDGVEEVVSILDTADYGFLLDEDSDELPSSDSVEMFTRPCDDSPWARNLSSREMVEVLHEIYSSLRPELPSADPCDYPPQCLSDMPEDSDQLPPQVADSLGSLTLSRDDISHLPLNSRLIVDREGRRFDIPVSVEMVGDFGISVGVSMSDLFERSMLRIQEGAIADSEDDSEEAKKMRSCSFFSGVSDEKISRGYLKCAVNPAEKCLDCQFFEESLDA